MKSYRLKPQKYIQNVAEISYCIINEITVLFYWSWIIKVLHSLKKIYIIKKVLHYMRQMEMAKQRLSSRISDTLNPTQICKIYSQKTYSLKQIPIIAPSCCLWFYYLKIKAILTQWFPPCLLKEILFLLDSLRRFYCPLLIASTVL